MSREPSALSHHPAPKAERLSTPGALFLLFAGPLAWLLQLSAGFMLISWPCYPSDQRLASPIRGYGWTGTAAIAVLVLCTLVAAASGLAGLRKYREVQDEHGSGHEALLNVGHGRTRFIALWGAILGFSFAVAALVTLVAFILVPRCVG